VVGRHGNVWAWSSADLRRPWSADFLSCDFGMSNVIRLQSDAMSKPCFIIYIA
jgi:hypothetical protein